ncbi:MAG: phosphohydrolase, partial [Terriglobales bacterium]
LQAKLAQLPGFPAELKPLLEHLVISHHGQYEFGSPKLPMFPEALMLHYLDDLDSKMEAMRAHFDREAELEGPWTSYNASLGRPLLDSRKFLSGEKAPAAKANVQDSGASTVKPAAPERPTSAAPVPNLFSEQKA